MERRELNNRDLRTIRDRVQSIIDDIDTLLNDDVTEESAEGERGEALTNLQSQLDDALGYLELGQ